MKTIPCKKRKCLVYPTCRYKDFIQCTLLYNYYIELDHALDSNTDPLKLIKNFLPELYGIFKDKEREQLQL